MTAPLFLTDAAMVSIWGWLSTEHGPAMTANPLPPTLTPLTSMMLSSGWNMRLARLKGCCTRMAFSISGLTRNSSGSRTLVSPMTPRIVWVAPILSWMANPLLTRPSLTSSTAAWGAPFFITMIISAFLLCSQKKQTRKESAHPRFSTVPECLSGTSAISLYDRQIIQFQARKIAKAIKIALVGVAKLFSLPGKHCIQHR